MLVALHEVVIGGEQRSQLPRRQRREHRQPARGEVRAAP
jgi:hypothetical protein